MTTIPTIEPPQFFADAVNQTALTNDNRKGFPETVIMLKLNATLYGCVNTRMNDKPPKSVAMLCVFEKESEVELWRKKFPDTIVLWERLYQTNGEIISMPFAEAVEIARSKPHVHGLALQVRAQSTLLHFVR